MLRLIFDIETKARPEAVARLPEPGAPANYKDPEKVAAYVAEKRRAQLRDAALDSDTGEIAAIAMRVFPDNPAVTVYTTANMPEADLLRLFWERAHEANGCFVGYNILGFDLPFILRRSMALGVRPTLVPDLRRCQVYPVLDLYGILYNWQPGKSLKTVAKLYGLANIPDDALTGADVAGMDDATLRAYAVRDVDLTAALFERMCGVYLPRLDEEFPF